jgi:VIT1/CCC1 family predicted Fe2+/Mn2+ transporter
MTEITDYLNEKVAELRLARIISAVVWTLGLLISAAAFLWRHSTLALPLTLVGFSLFFAGAYFNIQFEFRRLDYTRALEKIAEYEQ